MAIIVRMKFKSLFDFIFTMLVMIYLMIKGIDDFVRSYSEYNIWLAMFLLIGFIYWLWLFGSQITRYVQTYLDVRSVHQELLLSFKGTIIGEGKVFTEE